MTFEWALSKLRDGRKVTRVRYTQGWSKYTDYWEYYYPEWAKPDQKEYKPMLRSLFERELSADDLEADDWILYGGNLDGLVIGPEAR